MLGVWQNFWTLRGRLSYFSGLYRGRGVYRQVMPAPEGRDTSLGREKLFFAPERKKLSPRILTQGKLLYKTTTKLKIPLFLINVTN